MSNPQYAVDENAIVGNGVNVATGGYLFPRLSVRTVCSLAEAKPLDDAEMAELTAIYRPEGEKYLGVSFGVDPEDLSQAGWGVIFADDVTTEAREALRPLLEHRAAQAGGLFREISGDIGYQPGESALEFLARFGCSPGPVSPTVLPYYLLLVGDPHSIPFEFQHQLDVIHAVGRISFDASDEYAAYAKAVIAADAPTVVRARTLGFFAPRHAGDVATQLSAEILVGALATRLRGCHSDWRVDEHVADRATKAQLAQMLHGDTAPTFLFSASHGVGFPCGHERQREHQGALLCQDWPGPLAGQEGIPPEQYFSADDVGSGAALAGSIGFFFACYGAGTPERDDFAPTELQAEARIAPAPFVARLPQRLLARGALAVVGHVDRAWGCSFSWPGAGAQTEVFRSMIESVMAGQRLGSAMDYFNQRYAAISTELTNELKQRQWGKQNDGTVAGLWTANNDARNYAIVGDPAVRLTFTVG